MKSGTLTYSGNVEDIVGETKGPSREGKFFVATDAVYDPETNKTKVEFDEVYGPGMTMEVKR